MRKSYLAIDIGATSGRHILKKDDELIEVYRFDNGTVKKEAGLVWDIEAIFQHVLLGIQKAFDLTEVDAIGIDTWAVDYVLLDDKNQVIEPVYSYRDARTLPYIDAVHEMISPDTMYQETGIQFQPFNTLYQLYTDRRTKRLDQAKSWLMLPEYLYYRLTKMAYHEYTNHTTTGLVSLQHKQTIKAWLQKLGLPEHLFKPITAPGVSHDLRQDIGLEFTNQPQVVLVPTHDTASAVHGVDVEHHELYVSSGTWSLLGIKTAQPYLSSLAREYNFSHEGGPGYLRLQKNIMGLYIIERLKEANHIQSIAQVIEMAKQSTYQEVFALDDPTFLSPLNMQEAINDYVEKHHLERPETAADYFKAAFLSIAYAYKKAIDEIEQITHRTYDTLTVFGGGAKNTYLNALIESVTKKKVIALAIEATALGNIKFMEENL